MENNIELEDQLISFETAKLAKQKDLMFIVDGTLTMKMETFMKMKTFLVILGMAVYLLQHNLYCKNG